MRKAGYTLIEVMTAVVVMTIGATGIVAMQGAAVRANQDASETSTAVNWGTTWVERIKRDARRWITTGNADLKSTTYLAQASESGTEGKWLVPKPLDALESPGADYFGFDTTTDIRFCVNLAMTVAHAYNPLDSAFSATSHANAVRADVRVWWHRSSNDVNRGVGECRPGTDGLAAATVALPEIRKTYLSTVVSWRAPGWF